MTDNERKQKALDIYKKLGPLMEELYFRWGEEKQYEDWKDYEKVFKKAVEDEGGVFLKCKNHPFSFTYNLEGCTYEVKLTSKQYSYKRIK